MAGYNEWDDASLVARFNRVAEELTRRKYRFKTSDGRRDVEIMGVRNLPKSLIINDTVIQKCRRCGFTRELKL